MQTVCCFKCEVDNGMKNMPVYYSLELQFQKLYTHLFSHTFFFFQWFLMIPTSSNEEGFYTGVRFEKRKKAAYSILM